MHLSSQILLVQNSPMAVLCVAGKKEALWHLSAEMWLPGGLPWDKQRKEGALGMLEERKQLNCGVETQVSKSLCGLHTCDLKQDTPEISLPVSLIAGYSTDSLCAWGVRKA